MRTALLICDHVLDKFESIDGQYLDMFNRLLPSLNLQPYYVCDGEFPQTPDQYDAYICTGSKLSVYDEVEWIRELQRFVKGVYATSSKFVGVCFGHQMIAQALGGEVSKAGVGWCIGAHRITIDHPGSWMDPAAKILNVLMLCQDQVVQLPSDSVVLASSKDCAISMFSVGDRMLGIQGHPEFSKEYDRALFESRVDRIGQEKVNKGIESINSEVHTEVMAQWILNFLAL